ncbi:MAG: hypothetical protein WC645_05150 [Candidatus Margulisiibacteriota bacterium]
MKKLIVIIAIFLAVSRAGAISDFDFWERQYYLAVSPTYDTDFSLVYEPKWEGPITLELQLSHNSPIRVSKVEFDGEDVTGKAAILRTYNQFKETFTISYDPAKLSADSKSFLAPGYHYLLVEIGNDLDKKIIVSALKIDPELNVTKATNPKEMKKLLGKLQDKRIKSLDAHFDVRVISRRGQIRVEQKVEGRLEATGENKFDYTFAYLPKAMINGRPAKENEAFKLSSKQKIGSPLRLWPLHPAYYISYDDLFNHYNWYLYKRIGSKAWMAGNLIHRDQWLPQVVLLVADEKLGVPLEFSAFIYNKEFIAAKATLEYNQDGLPIKQTLTRRLPNGEDEVSILTLTNLEANKRAPKKRWLLF